jgi:AcrR family transcriptional regulator
VTAPPRKRARADADKQVRRADILRAAAEAFAGSPYAAVTMADVARRAGLAKGTVYLYHATKESLFLQLVSDALARWFADVAVELAASPARLGPEALAGLLVRTLAARGELTRLLPLLHPVLEQNIDEALALTFKRRLGEQTAAAGAALERRFPGFRAGDGVRFLLRLHALAIGLHAMASPSDPVARALALPELAPLRVDFVAELQATVAALLRGWSPD